MTWTALDAEIAVMFRGFSTWQQEHGFPLYGDEGANVRQPSGVSIAREQSAARQARFSALRADRRDADRRARGIVKVRSGWRYCPGRSLWEVCDLCGERHLPWKGRNGQ